MTWNIDILDGVADCQGQLYPYPLPDECSLTQGFTGDDDGDIYNPSFINPPPSVSTTPFPTSFAMAGNDSEITFCVQGSGPSAEPTAAPTLVPTMRPSMKPTTTHMPTAKPSTAYPTAAKANTVSFQATQVDNDHKNMRRSTVDRAKLMHLFLVTTGDQRHQSGHLQQ